ncbi:MAG: hypothetical protein E6J34_24180 [Chloroflexi bacterium]|nr:MAG: hypothetical protein E6J34_24180 [Chloroflexota bacterium]
MSQATTLKSASCETKRCQSYIGVSQALRSTIIAFSTRIVSPLVMLALIASTLFIATSCGNNSSTQMAPTRIATTATPIIPNSYTPQQQGTLVLNDPLKDNSRGYKWDDNCLFAKDGYHISSEVDMYSRFCVAYGPQFKNFAFEVQMTILKGDAGGLFLRGDADNSKFYHLRIDQTGAFLFIIFTGHTSSSVLAEGTTSAFHQGAGQPNVLAVVAQGDRFTLYVNHQQIKSLTNGTYSQGQIGLVATDTNSPAEVVFTNARVWSY